LITIIAQSEQSGTIASQPVWLAPSAAKVNLTAIMNADDTATGGNIVGLAMIWYFLDLQPRHAVSSVWKSGLHEMPDGGYGSFAPSIIVPVPPGVVAFAGQLDIPRPLDIGLSMAMFDASGNDLPLLTPSGIGPSISIPVRPIL
jgi:hypothetical protein